MAVEAGVEDVGQNEDIGLCDLEILALVKFENVGLEVCSLCFAI